MKQIRKFEAQALRNAKLGDYVKHTWSLRKKTYYVVESKKALDFLEQYRDSIRVK